MSVAPNHKTMRLQSAVRIPVILIGDEDSRDLILENIEKSPLKAHQKKTLIPILKRAYALYHGLPENEKATTGFIDLTFSDISTYFDARKIRGGDRRRLRTKFQDLEKQGYVSVKKQLNVMDGVVLSGSPAFLYLLDRSIADPEVMAPDSAYLADRTKGATKSRRVSDKRLAEIMKQAESESYILKYDETQASRTEAIYCGLTDVVQRQDTRSHKDVKHLRGERNINGVRLLVTSQTSAHPNAELMAWNDQRVVRALITHLTYKIDEIVGDLVAEILGHPTNLFSQRQNSLFGDDEEAEDAEYEDVIATARKEISEIEGDLASEAYVSVSDQQRKAAELKARKMVRNDFILDVGDIALRLGARPEERHSGGQKRMINSAFRRIKDTTFHISLEGPNKDRWRVARKLGLMQADEEGRMHDFSVKEVGLIAGMKSQFEEGFSEPFGKEGADDFSEAADPYSDDVLERTRIWRLQVDLEMFDSLLDRNQRVLHRSHSKIMADPSPLSQALYNFFSAIIGKTNRMALFTKKKGEFVPLHSDNPYYLQPLEHLRQRVCPTRELWDLRTDLMRIMKKEENRPDGIEWDESMAKNAAKLWGHDFILFDRNAEARESDPKAPTDFWLYVKRDTTDSEIGDNSKYNVSLAKRYQEAFGMPVPKSRLPDIGIVNEENFLELIEERFG